jgi:hypothetical protein
LGFGLINCGVFLYFLYAQTHLSGVSWYTVVAASATAQALVYFGGVVLAIAIVSIVVKAVASRQIRHAPDAIFAHRILRVLEIIGASDRSWSDLATKNLLMREIESASRIVGDAMPTALSSADSYTDAWIRGRCNEIAASLRAKKTWVCMPKPDTRVHLERSFAKYFIDGVLGNWDSLEVAQPVPLSRQAIRARLRAFALGLFIALLPLAVYYGAESMGVLVPGLLADYLGFAVILWLVIAILLAVDPRFGEKVETVQKIVTMVPRLGKKGDA